MRKRKLFCSHGLAVLAALLCTTALRAEIVDGWKVNPKDASDPLFFKGCDGKVLHVLNGIGPVFHDDEEGAFGPEDYTVKLLGVSDEEGFKVMRCRASEEDFSAEYTLKFRKLADGAMEVVAEGGKNVEAFQCGNITGENEPFKQFYMGHRETEPWLHNDNWPSLIYWPDGGLYFYGFWDADETHAATYARRSKVKQSLLIEEPSISCDSNYAVLTDGSRPALKERYVIRAATDMWEAYGPARQKPSEYAEELSEMVFNDVWSGNFAAHAFYMDWLKQVTADRVKFLTICQQWGRLGFDDGNPDFYRRPDHVKPDARYGTNQERDDMFKAAKELGRFGVRFNYVLMLHPQNSYSYQKGLFGKLVKSDGSPGGFNDVRTMLPLLTRQDTEVHEDFQTSAVFHDQWASAGAGYPYNTFDADVPGAGTLSATRQAMRNVCKAAKEIHQGPMGSETLNGEFLMGEFVDTADFGIFAGEHRYDFTPEYKLRRLHQLTTTHSMGLGYRFFAAPWEKGWAKGPSWYSYFNEDEMLDNYRACEVLYGNGAYLFFYADRMRMVHALTECFTVGVAQRHYALQPVDYVKYGKERRWKTFGKILHKAESISEIQEWYKRFHIRYANGCHVWVNRDPEPLTVRTEDNRTFKLPKDGWLVYTEDGNLTAYTALYNDPVVAGHKTRVDFCEDKSRGIRYANPRKAIDFMGVAKPTVWIDGKIHYVLEEPETSFFKAYRKTVESKIDQPLVSEDFDKIQINKRPDGWASWRGGTFAHAAKSDDGGNILQLIDTDKQDPANREFYPTVMIPFMDKGEEVEIHARPLTIKMKMKCAKGSDGLNIFVAWKGFQKGDLRATGQTSGLTVRDGTLWASNTYGEDKAIADIRPGEWYEVEMHIPAGASTWWVPGMSKEKGFPQTEHTSGPWQVTVRQGKQVKTVQLDGFKRSAKGYARLVIQDKGWDKSQFSIENVVVSTD
ncbi:MAG: hypothetical protein ABFR33_10195 [Verrucomicrobiota bacterium]